MARWAVPKAWLFALGLERRGWRCSLVPCSAIHAMGFDVSNCSVSSSFLHRCQLPSCCGPKLRVCFFCMNRASSLLLFSRPRPVAAHCLSARCSFSTDLFPPQAILNDSDANVAIQRPTRETTARFPDTATKGARRATLQLQHQYEQAQICIWTWRYTSNLRAHHPRRRRNFPPPCKSNGRQTRGATRKPPPPRPQQPRISADMGAEKPDAHTYGSSYHELANQRRRAVGCTAGGGESCGGGAGSGPRRGPWERPQLG